MGWLVTVFLVLAVPLLFLHMPHFFLLFFLLVSFPHPSCSRRHTHSCRYSSHVPPWSQYHFVFLPLLQGLMMIDNKRLFIQHRVSWDSLHNLASTDVVMPSPVVDLEHSVVEDNERGSQGDSCLLLGWEWKVSAIAGSFHSSLDPEEAV